MQTFDYNIAPDGPRVASANDYKARNPNLFSRDLSRGYLTSRAEKLVALPDGGLGAYGTNTSRRLSAKEVVDSVEILPCQDRHCTKEQSILEDDTALVIPGSPLPSLPATNFDARPTQVTFQA